MQLTEYQAQKLEQLGRQLDFRGKLIRRTNDKLKGLAKTSWAPAECMQRIDQAAEEMRLQALEILEILTGENQNL